MASLLRSCRMLLLAAFLCACLPFGGHAQAAATVEEVSAAVEAEHGLPPLVQQRMQASVQAIAEQLLLGQSLASAEERRTVDEQVIHEVFDKVLVGYSVQEVLVRTGKKTTVLVRLLPWDDIIQHTEIDLAFEGLAPEIEPMAREDMQGVEEVFAQGMDGLPIAAADWTNGVLKRSLNAFMESHLPEFRADFDIVPEETAKVHLTVYPRLPVVRTVSLSMRSGTVPNFVLVNHRQLLQEKSNLMIGVPTAFVVRHRQNLEEFLAGTLDDTKDFRQYGLHTTARIAVGNDEHLAVESLSDTREYRLRLEGWADIKRREASSGDQEHTRFVLHAGHRLSQVDELFLRTDFYPQEVEWQWALGYSRDLSPESAVDIYYNMKGRRFTVAARYQIAPRWQIRYEYRWNDQMGEGGLRYRLHDFLGLEFVADKNDQWIRLIGDF